MWDTAGIECNQGMDSSEIQEASESTYCLQDQYKLVLQGGDAQQLSHQRTSSYLEFGDNIQAATLQWNTGVGAVLRQVHMQLQGVNTCLQSLGDHKQEHCHCPAHVWYWHMLISLDV